MEIVTQEWQYKDDLTKLNVKHPAKLGFVSKTGSQQAPSIVVRVPNLPADTNWAVLATLMNYGREGYAPNQTGVEHCVEMMRFRLARFETTQDSQGYRYATLKSSFSKGLGIACRQNHIALQLELIETNSQLIPLETQQVPSNILPIRTCRVLISERVMRSKIRRSPVNRNNTLLLNEPESAASDMDLRKEQRSSLQPDSTPQKRPNTESMSKDEVVYSVCREPIRQQALYDFELFSPQWNRLHFELEPESIDEL